MLHCIYLFFQLIHAFVRKCTNRSAGEKSIGNRSGWERIEPAQLGKELPNLPHGAEGDDYGRKRGVRQWKYVGLGAPLGLGEAEGWMHLLMMHRVWLLPMYLKGSFWQRIGFILGTLTWKTTHPFLFFPSEKWFGTPNFFQVHCWQNVNPEPLNLQSRPVTVKEKNKFWSSWGPMC